jgi:hypothetical protein
MINPAIIDAENHGSVNSYFKLYQMKNYMHYNLNIIIRSTHQEQLSIFVFPISTKISTIHCEDE